jgi:hypothetical protein
MSSDAWPSPDSPPPSLPRIEDLPIAERGYEQEAVRIAFDAFYRHAAQLDASLRSLEAVEVFRRDADALRNDLRALRALGVGGSGGSDPAWAAQSFERPAPPVPGVVFRLAAEAALLIAVAVVAGIGHFRTSVTVALMAAAFVVVAVSEWLASRARFVPPAVAFLPPPAEGEEPAPYVDARAPAWGTPALEVGEDGEPEAMTMVETAAGETTDPWEQTESDDEGDEGENVEIAERSGIFKRRRR